MTSKIAFSLLVASALLCGCDAVDTMKEGLTHSQAVSANLERTLGLKSHVGFSWNNGVLSSVTITFDGVPIAPSLPEVVSKSREAVLAEFKQAPKAIVVGFSVAQ
jgi:hypothetical protein